MNASRSIQVLAEEVIDQIAAGEVVERPASVARELLDNAVDAGATRIEVEFTQGGVERLAVRDDGCGIPADQVRLALRRHATSKIRSFGDLLEVQSLGFRGEALPSIASVSRFTLTSRTADAEAGVRLGLEGGRELLFQELGVPPGTCVEVEELFFNVPARRKFLSTTRTESNQLLEVCRRLVLARPGIHLVVREDGREVLHAPAVQELAARLPTVFGREHGPRLFPVARAGSLVQVRGFLSPPDLSRRTGDAVYLFVNGRHVKDRGLLGVLRSGYQALLGPGQFPLAALFLELDRREVDVNVHPQKAEVRFRNREGVHASLMVTIQGALAAAPWLGTRVSEPATASTGGSAVAAALPPATPPRVPPAGSWPRMEQREFGLGRSRAGESPRLYPRAADPRDPSPDVPAPRRPVEAGDVGPAPEPVSGTPLGFLATLRLLGQAGGTYLVCEGPAGLVIIDQHAAHERVTYEGLRSAWERGLVASQYLLEPERIELELPLQRTLEAHAPLLRRLGLELEHFGGDTYLVKSIPVLLMGGALGPLVAELLEQLGEEEGPRQPDGVTPSTTLHARLDRLLATMACHGSIRAGQALSQAEARALLNSLDRVDFKGNCPHGRPVLTEVPFTELERRMKRR